MQKVKIINLLKAKRNRCVFTRDTIAYDIYTLELEQYARLSSKCYSNKIL